MIIDFYCYICCRRLQDTELNLKNILRDLLKNKITLLLTLMCIVVMGVKAEPVEKPCDMLVVSTYSGYYRWSNRVIRNVTEFVEKDCRGRVEVMHIPLVSIATMEQLDSVVNDLTEEMQVLRPKTVMLLGSSTLSLCDDINAVCPGIPMIAVGGTDYAGDKLQIVLDRVISPERCVSAAQLVKRFNITMQPMSIFPEKTLDLMCTLMPELKNVYLVSGDDQFSHTTYQRLCKYAQEQKPELNMHIIGSKEVSSDSLIRRLSALDKREDAVIYASWLGITPGKSDFLLMNSAIYLLEASKAPCFVFRDNGWFSDGCNVLGGYLLNDDAYFEHLRSVVKDVVGGKSPREIPQYGSNDTRVVLDYRLLHHFDIDMSLVPDDTELINRPESIFERYLSEIVVISVAALLLIFLLVVGYMRRSITVKELKIRELETNRIFTSLFENMPIVYFRGRMLRGDDGEVKDLSVVMGNKNVRKVFHGVGRMLKGCLLMQVLPKSSTLLLGKLNECIKGGKTSFEFVAQTWNGLDCAFYVALDGIYVDVFGLDISDTIKYQRQLEVTNRELVEAKEKAESSERIKVEFVQNMSHEVRTPLNAICGFVDLLTSPGVSATMSDEERAEYGKIITQNAELLITLVDDILDFSSLKSGKSHINYSRVVVNEMCRMTLQSVQFRNKRNLEMKFVSNVDDNYSINTDARRVQQVLVNYLTNALKHTDEGSITLEFRGADADGWCEFSCADTGDGVPEGKGEEIFERFYKVNSFRQGTGLGLAICRSVAELLGGEVYLDTTYTGGARFVLRLKV